MKDEIKISSVSRFLETVFQKSIALKRNDSTTRSFWFRGESDVKFITPLVPNAYRVLAETFKNINNDTFYSHHIKLLENNISYEFHRKALPFILSKKIDNTPWNRYFIMQHYNIYTRLLDWTENALLALFFSISENKKKDGVVWILQPSLLNSYTIKTILNTNHDYEFIPSASDIELPQELKNKNGDLMLSELTRRYLRMDFNTKDSNCNNTYYPLAIYPPFLDNRMAAQRACFTIFGNKINGLLDLKKSKIKVIDSIFIDGNSKEKMLEELRLIGIDHESIYPDLDGLGNSIMNKYKRKYYDNRETIITVLKSSGMIEKDDNKDNN